MFRNNFFSSFLLLSCLLFLSHVPDVFAGGRTVTWFLDGAKVKQDLLIEKSYGEIILPPFMMPGSLRITPVGSSVRIGFVDLEPVKPGKADQKELARIDERREFLKDRLKALSVKEDIFKAAAKSQGSKAPKRTRTNPEPLSGIRQGTDFAIERLEEVYRATRKIQRELKELELKSSSMQNNARVAGTVAKIRLEGKRGTVRIAYLTKEKGWIPCYDLRVSGETAELTLKAKITNAEKNDEVYVVSSGLFAANPPQPMRVVPGSFARVAVFRLPVMSQTLPGSAQQGVEVTLRNDTGQYLPPGESAGFFSGEFTGFTHFAGMNPAERVVLVYGLSEYEGHAVKKSE